MADNNSNKEKKKSPFSVYWIYAIIGVALIAFQLYSSSGGSSEIQQKGTFWKLAQEGGLENVTVITNMRRVDFQLTDEGKKVVSREKSEDFNTMEKAMKKGRSIRSTKPTFSLKIGDIGTFEEDVRRHNEKLEADKSEVSNLAYGYDEEVNYLGGILSFILPIVIIIALWMFVMRRMSGGAGGGGAGQIFNIGKSKAKVYEKGKSTDTTFADVAGLEGAKEEVEEIVDFLKKPKKYTALGAKIPKGASTRRTSGNR